MLHVSDCFFTESEFLTSESDCFMRNTRIVCTCNQCKGNAIYSKSQVRRHIASYGQYFLFGPEEKQHDDSSEQQHVNLFQRQELLVDGVLQQPEPSVIMDDSASADESSSDDSMPQESNTSSSSFYASVVTLCQAMSTLRATGAAEKHIVEVSKAWKSCLAPFIAPDYLKLLPTTAYRIDQLASRFYPDESHIVVKCANTRCNKLHRGLSKNEHSQGHTRSCQCGTRIQLATKTPKHSKFVVFDLIGRIRRVWGNQVMADLLHYPRDQGDGDVWDAALYNNLSRLDDMCFSITCDGATLQKTRNVSWTPIILRWLNLPPHVRTTAGGMFLWAHLPHDIVIDDALQYLLTMAKTEFRDGFEVFDAHEQKSRQVKIKITRVIEDYQ